MKDDDQPIRVLHVDDDEEWSARVVSALSDASRPFTVDTARHAGAALDALTNGEFDCVVSEVRLPGRDGVDFLTDVRERHGDLPFVVFTGSDSGAIASDAIAAGVTDYLPKETGRGQLERLAERCARAVDLHRDEERAAEATRIRTASHAVGQALLRAESVTDLERRVCSAIAGVERYVFVWIGVLDPATSSVEPIESAGHGDGYLSTVNVTTDDTETGRGPTGRAVQADEIQVVQDIESDADYEPWRAAAMERGFRSSAAVPFRYADGRVGVLNVYADRPDAFDESDRALLSELGADITHTLGTLGVREELRQQTARMEALFEQSPDMIDVHDGDGRIIRGNPRFFEKLGYEEAELVGEHVWEIDQSIAPEEAADIWAGMEPGDRYELEGRYRRKDGSTFPVEVHLRRLDVDGESRFVVISRDVSERRRRERERQEVIDRVTDAIVQIDEEWRFTLVDHRAEELYGMAESSLLGRDFWEVFPEAIGTRFEEEYRRAMATREPASFEEYFAGLDNWFDVQVYPDDGGGLSFYFRETTERKAHERELKRYETIVQTTNDPIFVLDDAAEFVEVNTALAELTGIPADELLGSGLSRVADATAVEEVSTGLAAIQEGAPGRRSFETSFATAEGGRRQHAVSTTFVDQDGRSPVAICIAHDVSDLRAHERRLSVLDRVLRHNPRNKLNVIMGHAEALSRAYDPDVVDRATTVLGTAEDLMELSEIARQFEGVVEPGGSRVETMDAAEVSRTVVERARREHPDATFTFDAPGSTPVRGHRTLELALEELVDNAVVHSDRPEPTVDVSVSVADDAVEVCVADDGPGLDDRDRDALVRGMEFPLEHTQGLGLWLVRWTVENLAGSVSIEPRTPRGTVVVLRLPPATT